MRWHLLIFALACALLDASHGSAQSPASEASLATTLRATLAAHPLPGARVGISVALADSGRVVFAEGGDLSLNPASNTKILTAAAALGLLGGAETFLTSVTGVVDGDDVRGLTLRGGGDPSLRARDLDALAAELAARGIRRASTGLALDDTRYGGELLPPGFEQQPDEDAGFRPVVSALAVESAAYAVNLVGGAVGAPCAAWVLPTEAAALQGRAVTAATGGPLLRVDVSSDGRSEVALGGQCVAGWTTLRRRQLHPTRVAGEVFAAALRRYGVRVEGAPRVDASAGGETLASCRSAPVATLLQEAGKGSNNFTAEMMLLALAPPSSRTPAAATARVLDWLRARGVSTTGMVMRNGSGLYDSNRVTARQLTDVLRVPWRDPRIRAEFVAHLASAGEDGTLRQRLRAPEALGLVRAKTGTLDDVIALSGYVLSPTSGRTLVFSVLINGCRGRTAEARTLADEVALALARHARLGR